MKFIRCAAALLAAALCLGLCACGGEAAEKQDNSQAVSLWYVSGAPAEELLALAGAYADESGNLILARSFEDEESLAAALDSARPDLLLCSLPRAVELYDRGLLRDISSAITAAPEYVESVTAHSAGTGRGIFPIGSEVQLLYTTPGLIQGGAPDTMRALLELAAKYGRDTGLPFFTADSFGGLIYQSMLSRGEQLYGRREKDINSSAYLDAYNALAEAAFYGGLAVTEYSARELVDSGYLPCAAARSSSLTGLSADSAISLLPTDGDGGRLADCLCLAVTAPESRSTGRIARFISWLSESGRLSTLALNSGLVPAVAGASPTGQNSLTAALMELYDENALHIPGADEEYLANRESLENELRRSLESLQ